MSKTLKLFVQWGGVSPATDYPIGDVPNGGCIFILFRLKIAPNLIPNAVESRISIQINRLQLFHFPTNLVQNARLRAGPTVQ